MAKKSLHDELPSLEIDSKQENFSEDQKEELQNNCTILGCSVSIPFTSKIKGYASRRIDTSLTQTEALIFKAVCLALIEQKTRLKNGRYVRKPADVYRWIAEKIAEAHANND